MLPCLTVGVHLFTQRRNYFRLLGLTSFQRELYASLFLVTACGYLHVNVNNLIGASVYVVVLIVLGDAHQFCVRPVTEHGLSALIDQFQFRVHIRRRVGRTRRW